MAKMGRPTKKIDKEQFEKLCALQCTSEEIAGFFDCDQDTLNAWCKRSYDGLTFSAVQKIKSQNGKISLRRQQFKLAEKSANMSIWLGKQYLGQTDKLEADISYEDITPLATLLKIEESEEDEC